MAIIPKVGRRNLKTRLVIAMLYLALTAGALTMVYPFVLMISTSITSGADVNDHRLVPTYLYDTSCLFPKYAEDRYAGDVDLINQNYGTDFAKIENTSPPGDGKVTPQMRAQALDWQKFAKGLPVTYKQAGFEGYAGSPSKLKLAYQTFCRNRFGNDIAQLNKAYLEENESFQSVAPPFERFKMREWEPGDYLKMREWMAFKEQLPDYYVRPILIDPSYRLFLKNSIYGENVAQLNAAWGTSYTSYDQVHLAATVPQAQKQRADWESYVRNNLPFRYMSVDARAVDSYRAFLLQRYSGSTAELNARHETKYTSASDIRLPAELPRGGATLVDWMDFISKAAPLEYLGVASTENLYREHLASAYGTTAALNATFGTRYVSFDQIAPPIHQADWVYCSDNAGALRREFATRNYAVVTDYMLLHGRAVFNTLVFVGSLILVCLIVNPLCAYALSRYNLPYSYKVLLFLLATMAFPAEVAMIPNFLLLKQFHLLNTYWALILPSMANGYSIFLLKGFFDSLPKELYEAGIIDGASEATMFRKITIPMSKPIFAVIALQAFTGAYGAFMYAMLVCQDSKMWTMMVWLYQLQAYSPQYVTMAALTLAALPTLIVFMFTQNVIMRGIIIPSLK
jgi:ABC-type glycerol-3-phosphate transport system permease component